MGQYKGVEISFVPSDAMVSEAERGLAWREEFGRGGTEVGIARARDIKNKVDLSPDTVRRMKSFFARHEVDKQAQGFRPGEDGYPSNGRIAWSLWGGNPGMAWANRKADQMDKIDQESRSYDDMRPYPNEHAARLKDPSQYDSFARKNNDFGDGIDAIYGIKSGKSELQAIRFKSNKFTAAEARKWLKDHDFSPISFEEATGKKAEDMDIEKRHILNVAENDETYVITFAKENMYSEDEPPEMEEAQPETLLDVAPPVQLNPLEASPAMAMPLPVNGEEDRSADGIQHRSYSMEAAPVNPDERRVRIAVSSELPVERSFGMEILDHNPNSIDLSFLASGRAPLLLDHDPEKQIGIIEEVALDGSARVMRATVRFGKGGLAGEVFQDVVDGIRLRFLSSNQSTNQDFSAFSSWELQVHAQNTTARLLLQLFLLSQ